MTYGFTGFKGTAIVDCLFGSGALFDFGTRKRRACTSLNAQRCDDASSCVLLVKSQHCITLSL